MHQISKKLSLADSSPHIFVELYHPFGIMPILYSDLNHIILTDKVKQIHLIKYSTENGKWKMECELNFEIFQVQKRFIP